jgi:hypothetical protein
MDSSDLMIGEMTRPETRIRSVYIFERIQSVSSTHSFPAHTRLT